MITKDFLLWLAAIIGAFLMGGIMFSWIIPKMVLKKDMYQVGADHNPGAANVFITCGPVWGMVCLLLDMLKGFLPVFLAVHYLDTSRFLFSILLAAPVLGHAIAPFNHCRGGKCISTAFGELIGLFPLTNVVMVLAGVYILLSTVVKTHSDRWRSIAAFTAFGLISFFLLIFKGLYSVAVGCLFISIIAILKHTKYFAYVPELEEKVRKHRKKRKEAAAS